MKMKKFINNYNCISCYIIFIILLIGNNYNSCSYVCATHITGNFNPNTFFKFILKFGIQKTERHSQKDSFGYIFGNITTNNKYLVPFATFSVMDKKHFLNYYDNRTVYDKNLACQKMFEQINQTSYDSDCNPQAKGDYLRKIPCEKTKLCYDEDTPSNVVTGNQFTYIISDLNSPRFWYISMVACYRNKQTCRWEHYDHDKLKMSSDEPPPIINYDFQVVNGNPRQASYNWLVYHFSFDQQNILEMYLIFFIIYLVLVPMQVYAVNLQKHPVTRLFTASLLIEFISLCLILIHMIRFALNGVGNENLKTTGDIFDIFSRASFMLILLLLAKGWAVTRQQISRSDWIMLMIIWIPYCGFNVFLYVWNCTEVDIISDIDEYQTWPGWLVLACRIAFMLWFLWELRNTMKYEHSTKKLEFLLHFGASSLVWFIYLPVVAVVALQVSPLWRYKLLLGITNSADCLAYCVMTGLLWPNRSGQYLLLAGQNYSDELDEFNEAPHIVHGDTILPPQHRSLVEPLNANGNELIHSDNHLLLNGEVSTDILNGDDINLTSSDDLFLNQINNSELVNDFSNNNNNNNNNIKNISSNRIIT